MEDTLLHQLLDRALAVFRQVGVRLLHEEQLAAALDLSPAMFRELLGSKADVVHHMIRRDLERQRREHAELFAHLPTPAECLVALVRHSLYEIRHSPHFDYYIVRTQYPVAWQALQEHFYDYTCPLIERLVRDGVAEGQFRADLDAALVAHILLAQLNLVLNETYFPPDHTNLADAYYHVFAPYVRGLCTPAGLRLAAPLFERM
ncbi:hypothetical protein [Hymenobacter weizhouensis]|uniref:hypothetical protein n=1 Tax=Hymenobacter sp. YIM 151500-1 TaxID=2987689 RepID=UPI002225BD67|nr:hypothetical protein [Hymenobacter sp. YIM 151500-1]UYZ62266.1 hypothetical protein OIS53_14840 [Hymenobacter sp. YIM 151500-1]